MSFLSRTPCAFSIIHALLLIAWATSLTLGSAKADPECEGPIPFSSSKASPQVWSVNQSMGSDHQRPWVKVLPLSLLCSGLLLWCAFREKTEIDERLEVLLSDQIELPKVQLLKGCSRT
uniref:Uncharacterized protein n=1 Tax=Meleagris gallopavo TaxID=9103 RepID=A0A803YEG0_MELGA